MTSTKSIQLTIREISSRQNTNLKSFCDGIIEKGLLSAKVDFSKFISRLSEHLLGEEYVCSKYDFEYLNNCLDISRKNNGITLREILIEYITECFNNSTLKKRSSSELVEEISTSCVPSSYAFICSYTAIPLYLMGLIRTTEIVKNNVIFQCLPFSNSETTINNIFTYLPVFGVELRKEFEVPMTEFLLCFEWYVRELRVVFEISKTLGSEDSDGGFDLPPLNLNIAGLTNCLKWGSAKASEENTEFEKSLTFLRLSEEFLAKNRQDLEEAKKQHLKIQNNKRANLEENEQTCTYNYQELRR